MSRINTVFAVLSRPAGTMGNVEVLSLFTRESAADAYRAANKHSTGVTDAPLHRETVEQLAAGESNRDIIPRDQLDTVHLLIAEDEDSSFPEVYAFVNADTAEAYVPRVQKQWEDRGVAASATHITIINNVPLRRINASGATRLGALDFKQAS